MRARPWQRLRRHLSIERPHHRRLQRGQVLPIFAVMAVVILGGAALLTDAAWWWVNQQRMQRAADAGALAGAIYLPGDRPTAFAKARAESAKNGFTDGAGGVVVTPRVDPTDPRRLIVDIDGPVSTNFAKVFSMDSVDASAVGAATYVLPVPMGSPQSYYGVGFYQGIIPGVPVTTTGPIEASGPRVALIGAERWPMGSTTPPPPTSPLSWPATTMTMPMRRPTTSCNAGVASAWPRAFRLAHSQPQWRASRSRSVVSRSC